MAVQLQITLPLDWASDFDRVAERWYFFHRPSGFCQYLLPKTGDEITRAGELVPRLPPRPVQSIPPKMEAVSIIQEKKQSMVTVVEVLQTQPPPPILDATQVVERKVSVPPQTQQTPFIPINNLQQATPSAVPNVTPIRRASGPVARKPLPRQNSAPQQQPAQMPVQQRQDSQISPRSSISQTSIPENMVQQPLVTSPRSSISQASNLEFPIQQVQQQFMASSRNSVISQTSTPEVSLQQDQQQPMSTPRGSMPQTSFAEVPVQPTVSHPTPLSSASPPNQPQDPNSTLKFPQQQPNLQYTSTVSQSPGTVPVQEWATQQVDSGPKSAPVENPAVFWSDEHVDAARSLTQSQTWSNSSRPKLANRLSTSAIKMSKKPLEVSKKSYEVSKDYVKAHPGRATAIAGGIIGGVGVVAEACGVSSLSDAVAASKVYLNVKRAQQRKRISHSVPHNTAQAAAPAVAQPVGSVPAATGPSAKEVAEELFKMMQKQGQLPSMAQNSTPQNNNNQNTNQGATTNPQVLQQQYIQPQYTQPQFIPQPLFVQPDLSNAGILPFIPPSQPNLVQPILDPSIAAYQPPSSPPSPSQCPTPTLSYSNPSSPSFSALNLSPDPSTLQYDQFLQDQTTTNVVNQAILSSQAFTTSLTGQDMFVPGDLASQPVDPTTDSSALWADQSMTADDYGSDGDDGDDGAAWDSC